MRPAATKQVSSAELPILFVLLTCSSNFRYEAPPQSKFSLLLPARKKTLAFDKFFIFETAIGLPFKKAPSPFLKLKSSLVIGLKTAPSTGIIFSKRPAQIAKCGIWREKFDEPSIGSITQRNLLSSFLPPPSSEYIECPGKLLFISFIKKSLTSKSISVTMSLGLLFFVFITKSSL